MEYIFNMSIKHLLILLLIVFSLSKIISLESNIKVNDNQSWNRHFFDLSGMGGATIYYYPSIPQYGAGGLVGLSFGYQYAFTPYFSFGPGATGFFSIISASGINPDTGEKFEEPVIDYGFSGGCITALFSFGDLKNKKIAFLLDIGVGWMAIAKVGLYYKGFMVKMGYALTRFGLGHNITLDFGYKFNWAGKQVTAVAVKTPPVKETKPVEPVKEENKVEQLKDAKEGEVIRFDDIIFFPDIDTIKQSSYPVLDKIAQVLKERKDLSIEIGGYTNSTGKPKDELLLSTNRAMKVATYLIEKGIDAGRLKTAGYGSLNLKQATIDEANRRVEIKILKVGK